MDVLHFRIADTQEKYQKVKEFLKKYTKVEQRNSSGRYLHCAANTVRKRGGYKQKFIAKGDFAKGDFA